MPGKTELKKIKSLHNKKYRDLENKFIIEGGHLIEEAANSQAKIELILFTDEFHKKNPDKISGLSRKKFRLEKVTSKEMASISDTVNSQGILAVIQKAPVKFDEFLKSANNQEKIILLGLEEISDPGNLGTIIRTADWFGIDGVLLSANSVDIFNSKVVRSTMGSFFHLPIFDQIDFVEIIPKLQKNNIEIIGTAIKEKNYSLENYANRNIILFGNEARGLSGEILEKCNKIISIPSFGRAESLNVSIASGIILSNLRKSG